ncbi:hypothetical protein AB0K80_29130 [Streptomyces sp. NPDC052682]|uniref:hypothetical protein n=1 Tax=Streptomyces sp. NPDC052682 TaxID=3154954 RepID=UPI00342E9AF6
MPYGPYGPYVPPQPPPSTWRRMRDDEWPTLGEVLRGGRRGVGGCLGALLIIPCFWPLFLPLVVMYPMLRSARNRARRVFPSHGRRPVHDPRVLRVQTARAWAATVMSVLILVVYGKPEDMVEAREDYLTRLAIAPWLLLLTAPVVVAVVMRCASPAARRTMWPRLRAAGRSALVYVGAFTVAALLLLALQPLTERAEGAAGSRQLLIGLALFALLGVIFWVGYFLWFATGPAVRGAFNTAEVHPALPALLAGVLVWEFTAISLATGGLPPGPPAVRIAALLGGPLSVTAVAWWEIHRLRTFHGVRLRA